MQLPSFKKHTGFTLLEVMIAVGITAAVGAVSVQLLSGLVQSKRKTEIASERLASLQRFNQVINRDIQQIINRPHRDVFGNDAPALLVEGLDFKLEFSRLGWSNSALAEKPRATIQRVAYQTYAIDTELCEDALNQIKAWYPDSWQEHSQEDCLIRHYWLVLDRSSDSEPRSQVVLNQITSLDIEIQAKQLVSDNPGEGQQESKSLSNETSTYSQWPGLQTGDNKDIPVGLTWRMELPVYGQIERNWAVTFDDQ